MNPMAFVNVRFNDVERGLSEADARFVAEQLRIRRGEHHSIARELAERIERQAEAPSFAAPERDVELDEKEKVELVEALDALELSPKLDVVVLVTGDGDFTSLVQKLKMIGPKVEVYSFPRNTAKELREAADRFVAIDKRMLIRMPEAARPSKTPTGSAAS